MRKFLLAIIAFMGILFAIPPGDAYPYPVPMPNTDYVIQADFQAVIFQENTDALTLPLVWEYGNLSAYTFIDPGYVTISSDAEDLPYCMPCICYNLYPKHEITYWNDTPEVGRNGVINALPSSIITG